MVFVNDVIIEFHGNNLLYAKSPEARMFSLQFRELACDWPEMANETFSCLHFVHHMRRQEERK